MLKYIIPCFLCICTCPIAALESQPVSDRVTTEPDTLGRDLRSTQQPVNLADGQAVTNNTILGPTQELLPPLVATRTLQREDYFEWCLRWNKLQYFLAEQRAIPPRTIHGSVTSREGYSQEIRGASFWRPARVHNLYNSTSQTREEVWQIDGYGGGPVTVYNPFVTTHGKSPYH